MFGKSSTAILPAHDEQYQTHKSNITVVNEKGELSAKVAWWSDDPVADAIKEAKLAVRLYREHNVPVTRIVLDGEGKELFRFSDKDLDDTPKNVVYVCGGFYSFQNELLGKFHLVSPTKGLPYVCKTQEMLERMYRLTEHHSYMYEFNLDDNTVTCLNPTHYCGRVVSGRSFKVDDEIASDIKKIINSNGYWEIK